MIETVSLDSNDQEDYKKKIKEFIEMEKLKLLCKAIQAGLPES